MKNNVTTTGSSRSIEQDFAAYDSLPPAVQRAIQESAFSACCDWVKMMFKACRKAHPGAQEIVAALQLRRVEHDEIDAFSNQHRRRYGVPTPHAAAEVSIQRYHGRRASR